MTQQGYVDFIEAFEQLSLYELDYFCRILFEHYNAHLVGHDNRKVNLFDLREILTAAMKAAQVEIAERKLEEAKLNLALVRSRHITKEAD